MRCCSRLCIGDHIESLLNLMGTWTSESVQWCIAMTYKSALLAVVSAFSSVCTALLTVSTPVLSRLSCGQYMVWNKDIVILLILFNCWRFPLTSWYLWSCIFTGAMSSSPSPNHCFITAKLDGVKGKWWFWASTCWDLSCFIQKIIKCRPFCSHVSEENNSRISS